MIVEFLVGLPIVLAIVLLYIGLGRFLAALADEDRWATVGLYLGIGTGLAYCSWAFGRAILG